MPSKKYDIHERIFEFIIKVIDLTKLLPKTPQNFMITNQIMRSVTSMGANDQEADGALSRKDFVHCYIIVRKEGKETLFWLKLIDRTNSNLHLKIEPIIKEGNEIIAIVSTIVKKSNTNI